MVDLQQLILRQVHAGFRDLAGARAAAFIPVSDRLLNNLVAGALPPDAPVSEVSVSSLAGDAFSVRARISRAPLLVPPVAVTLTVVQQPELPGRPELVLRIGSSGLMSLAGPALRLLKALPPGIRADGDRLLVDIRQLLADRGAGWVLEYVADLQITTQPGALLVSVRMQVPEQGGRPAPTPAAGV